MKWVNETVNTAFNLSLQQKPKYKTDLLQRCFSCNFILPSKNFLYSKLWNYSTQGFHWKTCSTAQFHLTKPELSFYAGPTPARRVLRFAMVKTFDNTSSWKEGLTPFVGQPFRKNNSPSSSSSSSSSSLKRFLFII